MTTYRPDTVARPRCWRCGKLLAEQVTAPWRIRCPRCKTLNSCPEEVDTGAPDK